MKPVRCQCLILLCLLLAGLTVPSAAEQRLRQIEFRDQPLGDILVAFSVLLGRTVSYDATVQGRGSFYMLDISAEDAFALFLSANHLHVRPAPAANALLVSRLRVEKRPDGLFDAEARDIELAQLLNLLAEYGGLSIVWDSLPRSTVSINAVGLSLPDLVKVAMARHADYQVQSSVSHILIQRQDQRLAAAASGSVRVSRSGDLFGLRAEKERLFTVIRELFAAAGLEYALYLRNDSLIERFDLSERPFEELLALVLAQGGAGYVLRDGLYQLYPLANYDPADRFAGTAVYVFRHRRVADIQALLPARLNALALIRFDPLTNQATVRGLPEDNALVLAFFESVDLPADIPRFTAFPVRHIDPKLALELLPPQFQGFQSRISPGNDALLLQVPEDRLAAIQSWLAALDVPSKALSVQLRYIQPERFLQALPAGFARGDFIDTGDGRTLLFSGSAERKAALDAYLALADQPKAQIRYQLLIIQYERNDKLDWTRSFDARRLAGGDHSVVLGNIAQLLSLNFDVVSAFGYLFAAQLSLDLAESRARVFADTTLNGLSGQEIKFQNTTTYRYRELAPGDNDRVGVTREISSGLLVGLNGWVSGDGMITMQVSASVSKRGTDVSSNTGNPPTTSERIVSTTVRSRSGEPVILTGLIQHGDSRAVSGVPFLSRLPLIGWLFGNRKQTSEETEMHIYVIPRLDVPGGEAGELPWQELYRTISGTEDLP